MEIREFIEARLDEIQTLAERATPGPWRYNPDKMWNLPGLHFGEEFIGAGPSDKTICVAATGEADDPQSMADAAFIATQDPARQLREVAAKRAIVGLAEEATGLDVQVDQEFATLPRDEAADPYLGDKILRVLASAWSDHPDFDPAWRIDG